MKSDIEIRQALEIKKAKIDYAVQQNDKELLFILMREKKLLEWMLE